MSADWMVEIAAIVSAVAAFISARVAVLAARDNRDKLGKQIESQTDQLRMQNYQLQLQNEQLKLQTAQHEVQSKRLASHGEELKLQTKLLKLNSYVSITARTFEIDRLFVEVPDLRPYFYDAVVIDDPDVVARASAVAEFILDFYSAIQEHLDHLESDDMPSLAEWITYMQHGFKYSPFLCYYLEKRSDWYEDQLLKYCDQVKNVDLIKQQRATLG